MGGISAIEYLLARCRLRLARMHDSGGEQADATMPMDVVIPVEERARPDPRIHRAAEAVGVAWAILQGLKLRLGKRIIVGHLGAAMGLGDPQIHQQLATALEVIALPQSA